MELALARIHLVEARERALRLYFYGSTIIPSQWNQRYLSDMVVRDLTEFALHARRVSEIAGLLKKRYPNV